MELSDLHPNLENRDGYRGPASAHLFNRRGGAPSGVAGFIIIFQKKIFKKNKKSLEIKSHTFAIVNITSPTGITSTCAPSSM
jgi:hypothetical protein